MKIKLTFFSIVYLTVLSIACSKSSGTSCGKNFNWQQELSAETSAFNQAAAAYGQNPSPANCAAYKAAGNNYLNKADDLQSCANDAGQGTEFKQAIDQARQSINAIQC